MKIKIAIFLICMVIVQTALCQRYNFRNYGLREGLPQSVVYAIMEDHKGYLWFGTQSGVCRFDGNTFENFSTENGLPDNFVKAIFQDKDKKIWFGTVNGLACLDGRIFKVYTTKQGLPNNHITSIFTDKKDRMWVTSAGGIAVFDGHQFKSYTTEQGLPSNIVLCGMTDLQGQLWFGTKNGGVARFNGKEFQVFTTTEGLPSNSVLSCYQDRKGNIWLGTFGGIAKYNGGGFQVFTTNDRLADNIVGVIGEDNHALWFGTKNGISRLDVNEFQTFRTEHGLPVNTIFSMKQDKYGDIWFGTRGGGVSKLVLGNSQTGESRFQLFRKEHGLIDNVVRSLAEDRYGNIWFTTEGGLSRMSFDKKNTIFENFTTENGLNNNFLLSVLADSQGVWFSSQKGISYAAYGAKTAFRHFTTADGVPDVSIRTMVFSSKNTLWLGTSDGLVRLTLSADRKKIQTKRIYTGENGLPVNYIGSLLYDTKGRLWAGTDGGGLCRFLLKNDTIDQIQVYDKKTGLVDNTVFAITEDEQGKIWLATGGGVVKLNPETTRPAKAVEAIYGTKQGLQSQSTWLIAVSNDGSIWVGHEKGIECLDPETGIFRYYGYLEGFTPIETNQSAVCRDSKGNLWFGTMDGIMKYNPMEDIANQTFTKVHITDIKLFNKKTIWENWADSLDNYFHLPLGLKLPYNQNYITFEFVGIHFNIPEKVKYQYKLQGFDKEWSPITKNKYATYSNLPIGKYSFLVKAANSDNIWTKEPTSFSFEVTSPFWHKWWFYATAIAICWLLLLLFKMRFIKVESTKIYVVSMLIVLCIILLFEYILLLILPYSDTLFEGSAIVFKLIINIILASIILPAERIMAKFILNHKQ